MKRPPSPKDAAAVAAHLRRFARAVERLTLVRAALRMATKPEARARLVRRMSDARRAALREAREIGRLWAGPRGRRK